MAHGQNAQRHYIELWSRRPLAGYDKNASNKRLCRRTERSQFRANIKKYLQGKMRSEML